MKSYYQERAGRRYFRIWVPKPLRLYLNAEIVYPIHALDLQTALRRCRLLGVRLQRVFDRAITGFISMSILHPYIRELCANILYVDERDMQSGCLLPEEYEETKACYEKAYRNKDNSEADALLQILKMQGIEVDPNAPDTKAVIMNFYRGMIETCRILKERAAGNAKNGYDAPDQAGQMSVLLSREDQTLKPIDLSDVPVITKEAIAGKKLDSDSIIIANPKPKQPFMTVSSTLIDRLSSLVKKHSCMNTQQEQSSVQPQPTSQLPQGVSKAVCIRDGIELFVKEKKTTRNMDRKTEYMRRNMLSILTEWFGADCQLYSIERDQILTLRRDVLAHYPVNRQKQEQLREKTLKELLSMNLPAISEKTQSHYIEEWNVFFNWAVDCGYMTMNPARRLQRKQDVADLTEERPPFTKDELKMIFADLAETQSSDQQRPFRYWIPLIGLYQGMRQNEICQLYLDDIVIVDGYPCIRIQANRERKQRVKNHSSIRTIPIHSVLLKLGFLGYCLQCVGKEHRSNGQLFEDLTLCESGYQRKMQRFNARIHEKLKIEDRKTFHSLRHNFDTELSNKESNAFLIQCLDGHARQGELGSRYSKGQIPTMKATLEKLTYDLDIFKIMKKTPLTDEVIADQIKQMTVVSEN